MPIQIDEETYQALKRRAFEEGRSIASIIREALSRHEAAARPLSIHDFPFVGSGKSDADRRDRVSERHDAALAEAFVSGRRKRR